MAFIFVEEGEEAIPDHINQFGDALSGTPGKGQAILMTALNNAGLTALTVRNQNLANGRTLDVQKPDGSASWIFVDADGNKLEGVVFVQQADPDAVGAGYTTVWANSTDGLLYFKAGTGPKRPLNETNTADVFLLMGA